LGIEFSTYSVMAWIIAKYLITAGIIVAVTEIAKRSGKLGALITAMPMVAVLALLWMYFEKQPGVKIGSYATYTFWYVLPSLPMFLAFAPIQARYGFWVAMVTSVVIAGGCFLLLVRIGKSFGIDLL
jgi:hypothetical protein